MRAVAPEPLIRRALDDAAFRRVLETRPVYLLAVGKAAAPMAGAWQRHQPPPRRGVVIGTHRGEAALDGFEWHQGGHPVPTAASVVAARAALALAGRVGEGECLVVLLSGGASAAMAAPLEGLSMADKQRAVSTLLEAGADIHALNTVRKHLSAVKGGRLAAACRGLTWTLAVSDVVGDDPAVIGSGPTVPDASTFADARATIAALGVEARLPPSVLALLEAGTRGAIEESIKPGDPRGARATWRRIGGRLEAMAGAREEAEARGYHTLVLDEPVTGEAREAGLEYLGRVTALLPGLPRPACLVSSGETTVRVTGRGRGGRNQEFVLAAAGGLSRLPVGTMLASAGTDGIDGPTDAAGAVADTDSLARAAAVGLTPEAYLAENDSYNFFAPLGDLILTGPTDTNVGDVQVVVVP